MQALDASGVSTSRDMGGLRGNSLGRELRPRRGLGPLVFLRLSRETPPAAPLLRNVDVEQNSGRQTLRQNSLGELPRELRRGFIHHAASAMNQRNGEGRNV